MITIIYESKAGHTLKYVEMLSKKLNIPFYSSKEASKKLKSNDKIIYLGWICAGKVKGINKIQNKYKMN